MYDRGDSGGKIKTESILIIKKNEIFNYVSLSKNDELWLGMIDDLKKGIYPVFRISQMCLLLDVQITPNYTFKAVFQNIYISCLNANL